MKIEVWFLFLVALFGATTASQTRRRCVVSHGSSQRIALSPTCESCRSRLPTLEDAPRIMIVIAGNEEATTSPLLTVASQLIAARMRVVVVRVFSSSIDHDDKSMESILREKITSSIPCNVEPLLSFKWVPVKGFSGNIALDSPYNALDEADAEYNVLEFIVGTDDLPNVMVLEAANVGGQLVAEKLDIPSVLLAPHDMLNLVAEKTAPSTGFSDLFRRRKESFILAGRFMKMNKLRQQYGLPLLRNPSDYFETATVTLVNELAAPGAHSILPLHALFVSPLLPPCIPCLEKDNETTTIIVMTPDLSTADTRTLIRGLSMARAEFQSFVDDTCHPDNPGSDIHPLMCTFAQKMANFKVVWQVQNDTALPELPPVFMLEDSSPSLELLSSYSSTVAVISHCDSESYPVFALGQRLVCIPSSSGELGSPRLGELSGGGVATLESTSIASELVNLLIGIHDETVTVNISDDPKDEWHPLTDGGNLTVQIIETIATSPRNETADHLRERVNERVGRTSRTKTHIVSLLVVSSAWNVLFVISLGYCLRLIHVTADLGRTNQTKRFLRSPSVQVVFQYLEELDWALLFAEKFWWCDDSMIHNRIDRFLRRYEQEEEVAEANQPRPEPKREASGHNVRRKRHTRKR